MKTNEKISISCLIYLFIFSQRIEIGKQMRFKLLQFNYHCLIYLDNDVEINNAIARQKKGQVRIVPILINYCIEYPFYLQFLPKGKHKSFEQIPVIINELIKIDQNR